ncbi:uncharacterized protein LOC103663156 isoform X2 [Ursus maritimus]|uniref:Uncharacterized protein LOC103663156 isoform X2 n=1 Tax=Ursus maritimus TaxID=29073 RepID=A0A8M1F3A1_URSMA|nr:uncharacterized protein LOC103663156 isoform X2 [Ursus maritimus]
MWEAPAFSDLQAQSGTTHTALRIGRAGAPGPLAHRGRILPPTPKEAPKPRVNGVATQRRLSGSDTEAGTCRPASTKPERTVPHGSGGTVFPGQPTSPGAERRAGAPNANIWEMSRRAVKAAGWTREALGWCGRDSWEMSRRAVKAAGRTRETLGPEQKHVGHAAQSFKSGWSGEGSDQFGRLGLGGSCANKNCWVHSFTLMTLLHVGSGGSSREQQPNPVCGFSSTGRTRSSVLQQVPALCCFLLPNRNIPSYRYAAISQYISSAISTFWLL